ncbi:hypothetical protein [Paraburkholderia diazotrophica]|uniref:Uncharacterized protein n=1 Tax=Paraburkholderia diazotrophica TaxID=667676 RepID=A0A1H6RZL7_9BURK|nr:hypothetical protein [Paraburkholderia diazotrophica]SEI61109.1 hypothetical protein SAMN05192539_10033 [Paraburkholderia diazotrophica]
MKAIFLVLTLLLAFASQCVCTYAADSGTIPNFSDYPVEVYNGHLKVPNYYKKTDGEWRDDMGKLTAPPEINFAGKYYIGSHSCGAGCRYYTLSDLASGSESNALDMFSNDERHSPKTFDGRSYVTSLVSRPDSKMLVAQYHIEQGATSKEECRERIFLLSDEGKKAKPITKTINHCEDFQ